MYTLIKDHVLPVGFMINALRCMPTVEAHRRAEAIALDLLDRRYRELQAEYHNLQFAPARRSSRTRIRRQYDVYPRYFRALRTAIQRVQRRSWAVG